MDKIWLKRGIVKVSVLFLGLGILLGSIAVSFSLLEEGDTTGARVVSGLMVCAIIGYGLYVKNISEWMDRNWPHPLRCLICGDIIENEEG